MSSGAIKPMHLLNSRHPGRLNKQQQLILVRAGPLASGHLAAREPTHKKSVNCHRDRRESFFGFKQAPSLSLFSVNQ